MSTKCKQQQFSHLDLQNHFKTHHFNIFIHITINLIFKLQNQHVYFLSNVTSHFGSWYTYMNSPLPLKDETPTIKCPYQPTTHKTIVHTATAMS